VQLCFNDISGQACDYGGKVSSCVIAWLPDRGLLRIGRHLGKCEREVKSNRSVTRAGVVIGMTGALLAGYPY